MKEYQICTRGLWDTTVPGVSFNKNGVSNYATLFDTLVKEFPRGESGKKIWNQLVTKMKKNGEGKKYDCVIGVSGGVDSCYLLHIAKMFSLRVIAVNLDNGWNSDIAVKNIRKVTTALNYDLETYVIDYEEIKDLNRVFMKGGIPWVDTPTDLAIKAILYKVAASEKIRYILRGNDFRSEGTQPIEWTGGDARVLKYLHRRFGHVKLRTFPNYTIRSLVYYGFIKKIKSVYPYYFIDYKKSIARKELESLYNWEYYGGHHYENVFTKFVMSYWLVEKFGIDKRKISLSAQILSGDISRNDALEYLSKIPLDETEKERIIPYVLKKLDFSHEEFEKILQSTNHSFLDYPSYYPYLRKFSKLSNFMLKHILLKKPMAMFQIEMREQAENQG